MLFDDQFQSLDEIDHGFAIEPVPLKICQRLWTAAFRGRKVAMLKTISGGFAAIATWTADGLLRIVSDGTPPPPIGIGPGTELKKLLSKFGITPKTGCGCNPMAAEMNRLGPDWCLANEEKIIAVMEQEAQRRKLPFMRMVASQLLRLAVRRSRAPIANGLQ